MAHTTYWLTQNQVLVSFPFSFSTTEAGKPSTWFPSCPCRSRLQCDMVVANEIEVVVCWESFGKTCFLDKKVDWHGWHGFFPPFLFMWPIPFPILMPGGAVVSDREALSQEWENRKWESVCVLHDIIGALQLLHCTCWASFTWTW